MSGSANWSTIATYVIVAVGALGLLGVGAHLAIQDRTASASTTLGIGFLLIVVLTISNYKHIKGFGFEAEMWDQKQIEAAILLDRLKGTSEAASRQLALIASKVGLWDSSYSNPELADLLDDQNALLTASGTPEQRRGEILAPVIVRIKLNYWNAARQYADKAYRLELEEGGRAHDLPEGERTANQQRMQTLGTERVKIGATTYQEFQQTGNLNPIISVVRDSIVLHDREKVLRELNEINEDLLHFDKNHQLRRKIALEYLGQ